MLASSALLLLAHAAVADESSDQCLADSLEGQILRSHGKVARAAEYLERCARPECEPEMRTRCAQWLEAARAAIPILSVQIVDDRGAPLRGAVVRIDGSLVDASQPVTVDPGHHELRADYAGRRAIVAFETTPGPQPVVATIDLRASVPERPVPVTAYVAGGVSLAGFVAGAVLGIVYLEQRSGLSGCMGFCDASTKPPLTTEAWASDVGIGVGVAGLLAGTIFYLARPTVMKDVRVGARGVAWAF